MNRRDSDTNIQGTAAGAMDIVETTRVRLARNFADTPFAQGMSALQKQVVRDRVYTLLKKDFTLVNMNEMTPLKRQSLVEKHCISVELSQNDEGSVLLSGDGVLSVMINEEDHVRIQCILPGMRLEEADTLTRAIDNILCKEVYAFDGEFGYLTSCPTNVGTGMRASVMLHLPALAVTGSMPAILENIGKFGFALRGFYGEGSSAAGNMYQLSNQVTLGISEDEILQGLSQAVKSITEKEEAMEKALLRERRLEASDFICRSLGTLRFARSLDSAEMMQHLSNVKAGLRMGLLTGLRRENIQKLIYETQPATLQLRLGGSEKTRDEMRADMARQALVVCEVAETNGAN